MQVPEKLSNSSESLNQESQPSGVGKYAGGDSELEALVRPAWKKSGLEVGDERPQPPEEAALMRVGMKVEIKPGTLDYSDVRESRLCGEVVQLTKCWPVEG